MYQSTFISEAHVDNEDVAEFHEQLIACFANGMLTTMQAHKLHCELHATLAGITDEDDIHQLVEESTRDLLTLVSNPSKSDQKGDVLGRRKHSRIISAEDYAQYENRANIR